MASNKDIKPDDYVEFQYKRFLVLRRVGIDRLEIRIHAMSTLIVKVDDVITGVSNSGDRGGFINFKITGYTRSMRKAGLSNKVRGVRR